MTPYQFKEAFRRGLGIAIIELTENENRDAFRDIVLWCCLHNTCYDMQCEGDRSSYLYSAICLFNDTAFFERAIISEYSKSISDTKRFMQLSGLLYCFAADGSEAAKTALDEKFEMFMRLLSRGGNSNRLCEEATRLEFLCVWLTSLGGYASFKEIIRRVSIAYARSSNGCLIMDWLYANSINKFGGKRIVAYMEAQSLESTEINAYWHELQKTYYFKKGKKPHPPTLREFMDACRQKIDESNSEDIPNWNFLRSARFFAKSAGPEDLTALANTIITEPDIRLKSALLNVFRFTPSPLNEKYLFDLLDSQNEALRENAYYALEHVVSDNVHNFAVQKLLKAEDIPYAIGLLCKNYRPEDEALIFASIKKLPVSLSGEWHGAYRIVQDLFDARKIKPKTGILLYMYRKTLCSYCRHHIVSILHRKGMLTDALLEECLYDSYDETQKLAQRIFKRRTAYKACVSKRE